MKKKNMFSITGVLLYDVIPCINLKDLCKEATELDLNANECKQGPIMGIYKMNMFECKKNIYKKIKIACGKYVSSYYCIDLCSIKF
jgi:hypothetical protein